MDLWSEDVVLSRHADASLLSVDGMMLWRCTMEYCWLRVSFFVERRDDDWRYVLDSSFGGMMEVERMGRCSGDLVSVEDDVH